MRLGLALLAIATLATLAACKPSWQGSTEYAVKKALKDPDSATFSQVTQCITPGIVMGFVNAKNSYGGFTGPQPFVLQDGRVYFADTVPATLEDMDKPFFTRLVDYCSGAGPKITEELYLGGQPKSGQ